MMYLDKDSYGRKCMRYKGMSIRMGFPGYIVSVVGDSTTHYFYSGSMEHRLCEALFSCENYVPMKGGVLYDEEGGGE